MPQRMTGIDIVETSGVDHPAHLHEGFLVMKSADPDRARRIMAAVTKREGTMEKQETEAIAKAVADQIKPILDDIAAAWQGLRAVAEAESEDTPTPAAGEVDPAADPNAASAEVLAAQEALKALPEHLRGIVEKSRTEAREARETAQKAIDERLDDQAVAASRAAYKSLALDHDTLAPALRRIEAAQPDVAKSVREALAAADAQAGESLLVEVGTARKATASGAYDQAQAVAKSMVADGSARTLAEGITKAFEANPALYAQYQTEQKG